MTSYKFGLITSVKKCDDKSLLKKWAIPFWKWFILFYVTYGNDMFCKFYSCKVYRASEVTMYKDHSAAVLFRFTQGPKY